MRDEMIPHRYPLRPEVQDQLAVAMKQKFRVEACETCGGPRVFSKRDPIRSRCLRCGRVYLTVAAKPQTSFRRCAFCGEQKMTGRPMRATLCLTCSKLPLAERKRRQAYRDQQATASKAPINTGTDQEPTGGDGT
jgi:hypothetical protein